MKYIGLLEIRSYSLVSTQIGRIAWLGVHSHMMAFAHDNKLRQMTKIQPLQLNVSTVPLRPSCIGWWRHSVHPGARRRWKSVVKVPGRRTEPVRGRRALKKQRGSGQGLLGQNGPNLSTKKKYGYFLPVQEY
jgi:hypothetical protein